MQISAGRQAIPCRHLTPHAGLLHPAQRACVLVSSAGLLALLVDLESLAELVSIGTLFVFFMVSAAVLWSRHFDSQGPRLGLVMRLVGVSLSALGGFCLQVCCILCQLRRLFM